MNLCQLNFAAKKLIWVHKNYRNISQFVSLIVCYISLLVYLQSDKKMAQSCEKPPFYDQCNNWFWITFNYLLVFKSKPTDNRMNSLFIYIHSNIHGNLREKDHLSLNLNIMASCP